MMKATTVSYKVSMDEAKNIFGKELNLPKEVIEKNLSVRYIIQEVDCDPMDRYPGHLEVTGIELIVKEV